MPVGTFLFICFCFAFSDFFRTRCILWEFDGVLDIIWRLCHSEKEEIESKRRNRGYSNPSKNASDDACAQITTLNSFHDIIISRNMGKLFLKSANKSVSEAYCYYG